MKKILTATQKKFLEAFQKSELSEHFYWSGGTLLAYFYLQHRLSEDLDFFSENLFPDEFIAAEILKIKKITRATKVLEHKRLNRSQFVFEYGKENLKIEFVYYPFPAIEKTKMLREFHIHIDSLKDIATNKMHAAFERSEPKDVYDLYHIIHKGKFHFLELFEWVAIKFGTEIDPAAFIAKILESLSKIERIRPLLFSQTSLEVPQMEDFFRKEAFSYLKKKI